MEVHHHHKLDHKAKPWKEYLLEGIMIFIAVSLGYAAENLREHFIENKKAIVMARNLFFDVKADSATMANTLRNRANQDSCFEIVNGYYNGGQEFYHNATRIGTTPAAIDSRLQTLSDIEGSYKNFAFNVNDRLKIDTHTA